MSNEYEKKNEPSQGQKDDKSLGGRQGQNPQDRSKEKGEPETWREGQPGSPNPKKPSTGDDQETE